MANQENYPNPLQNNSNERPIRITHVDESLIKTGDKQVIFGTTERDVVEIWIYYPDGSFAGHINLPVSDPALNISTILESSGPTEVLTIDLADVAQRTGLESGHYSFVANFFRNEVGSESSYKLYIDTISNDRTELRLYPITPTTQTAKDIFEFVVPSVPRQFAKGLLDEVFGEALQAPPNTSIDINNISTNLEASISGTLNKITTAAVSEKYQTMVMDILHVSYLATIEKLAADDKNLNIQSVELEAYVKAALQETISNMVLRGQIDPRFHIE